MEKRGQVAIFIIVAVVAVVAVVLFFLLRGSVFGGGDDIPVQVEEVYDYVSLCIEEVGANSLYYVAAHGGYYGSLPSANVEGVFPIYYFRGNGNFPMMSKIAEELEDFMEDQLVLCLDDFSSLGNYDIVARSVKAKVEVSDEEIIFDVEYPLSIKRADETYVLKNFEGIKIDYRFGEIYTIIQDIIFEQMDHDSVCLTCLYDAAYEEDLYVDMYDYDENTVVFVFEDKNAVHKDETFKWVFANEYNWEDVERL